MRGTYKAEGMKTTVCSYGFQVAYNTVKRYFSKILCCLIALLAFTIYYSLFTICCYAEEPITINADTLQYLEDLDVYQAKGSVRIKKDNTTLEADTVNLNATTGDFVATGNVVYNDGEATLRADKIELNINTRLGIIYKGSLFYQPQNYHIRGEEFEREKEDVYRLKTASFTTCDSPFPAWSFRARDVKVTLDEDIKAKKAVFYIKGIPVFYVPYLWVPIKKEERHTGLLIPIVGYSNKKGMSFRDAFFWAIRENRDLTLYLDYYSKRGVGKGIEYRYIEDPDNQGNLYLYHIKDKQLNKDFVELKGSNSLRFSNGISGFLDVNVINGIDFYKEYSLSLNDRLQRYIESNLYVTKDLSIGKAYLLSQYRENLSGSSSNIPQKAPELGFFSKPKGIGLFMFYLNTEATNFWSKDGTGGQRFDLYPQIYGSIGDSIVFSHKIALRETAYSLNNWNEQTPHRELLDTSFSLGTKLYRDYGSLLHIIEPEVGYSYISNPAVDIPLLDSIDTIKKTSAFDYSILNRFFIRNREMLIVRIGHGYDLLNDRFSPVRFETALMFPVTVKFDASYNTYARRFDVFNTALRMENKKGFVALGERFDRSASIRFYTMEVGHDIVRSLSFLGRMWYDTKGSGLRELKTEFRYTRQCWGIRMTFVKKPGEYQTWINIEFRGLGSLKLG